MTLPILNLVLVVGLAVSAAALLGWFMGRRSGADQESERYVSVIAQLLEEARAREEKLRVLSVRTEVLALPCEQREREVTAIQCKTCRQALGACSCPKALAGKEGQA